MERLSVPREHIYIVECICSVDVVISRLRHRKNDYSDADISIYNKMKKIYEPVKGKHIIVDTSEPSKVNTANIATQILKNN